MNKYRSLTTATLALIASFLLISCTDASSESSANIIKEQIENAESVEITSLDDLNNLFEKLQYTPENWNQADREIPRIVFEKLSEKWAKGSANLPVNTKKTVFFRLMTPLSLLSNEAILRERQVVESAPLDSALLNNIALKYRVIENNNVMLTEEVRQTLLTRVDVLPSSLVLAQAAEESGWGTSRFALEGNAFFGQWDFTGNGMKPKKQREELGNYGVKRFDSPIESVQAYMLNINTNAAYQKLRTLRKQLRDDNAPITGHALAGTLDKYSERGEAYITGLRQLMTYNKLAPIDDVKLSNEKLILLVTD